MKDYSDLKFNWQSEILAQVGYGIQARRILRPLIEGGASIKLIANEHYIPEERKINDFFWKNQLENSSSLPDSDIQINFSIPEVYNLKPNTINIGYTMWETDCYPKNWARAINNCSRFLVGSPALVSSAKKAGISVPIDVLESSLDVSLWTKEGPKLTIAGSKPNTIKYLFIGNWIPRKNYEDLITAFSYAFNDIDDVELVIKTWGSNNTPEAKGHIENGIRHITSKLSNINRPVVSVITDLIPEEKIANLMRGCDVYVSASHGEGFDLPLTQAMACGMLVVANDFLGHCYLDNSNALLYPYTMTPVVGSGAPNYDTYQMWSRPDMGGLINKLRESYNLIKRVRDKDQEATKNYNKLINNAQTLVKTRFNPETIADHLAGYIRAIRDAQPSQTPFNPQLVSPLLS